MIFNISILPQVTALSEQTRQVAVPGVGVASQLGDGTVRVSFSDGAQRLLRPNMNQVRGDSVLILFHAMIDN